MQFDEKTRIDEAWQNIIHAIRVSKTEPDEVVRVMALDLWYVGGCTLPSGGWGN